MSVTIYGIKNCDSVKKARKWFEANNIAYDFHDFRADGMDSIDLNAWEEAVGFDVLINRRGTTYRKLSQEEKNNISLSSLSDNPTLIKRPVVDVAGKIAVGVDFGLYESMLA